MALLRLLFKMVLNSVGVQEEYTAFDGLKTNVMERRTLQIHLGEKGVITGQRKKGAHFSFVMWKNA